MQVILKGWEKRWLLVGGDRGTIIWDNVKRYVEFRWQALGEAYEKLQKTPDVAKVRENVKTQLGLTAAFGHPWRTVQVILESSVRIDWWRVQNGDLGIWLFFFFFKSPDLFNREISHYSYFYL